MEENTSIVKIQPQDQELQESKELAFDAVSKSGDYLSRLQLMTSSSAKCKTGDFPINHYAIVRDQDFTDLGKTIDVIVLEMRPKALDMNSDDGLLMVYDHEDSEFKRIQKESDVKDSGCMFGPEFLVWLPSAGQFLTFFMGSKSARRESPQLNSKLGQAATLGSHQIKTRTYTWFAPLISSCSTPPANLPEQEDIDIEVEKFRNPPKNEVETVTDGEGQRER